MSQETKKPTRFPTNKSETARPKTGSLANNKEPLISNADEQVALADTLLKMEPKQLSELIISVEAAKKLTSNIKGAPAPDTKKKRGSRLSAVVIGAAIATVATLVPLGLTHYLSRPDEAFKKTVQPFEKSAMIDTATTAERISEKTERLCMIPGDLENVETLVAFCASQSTTACSRENAMKVIKSMDARAVPILLNILETTDKKELALVAAEALERIRPLDAMEKLARIIIDPQAKHREIAAAAFMGIAKNANVLKPERADTFIPLLKRDSEGKIIVPPEAYIGAIIGIGKTTHPDRIDVLKAIIEFDYCKDCNYPETWKLDPYDEGVAVHPAVVALVEEVLRKAKLLVETWKLNASKTETITTHPAFIAFIKSKEVKTTTQLLAEYTKKGNNPSLRRDSVWALGKMGNPTAVKVLLPLLDDKDKGIRLAAVNALRDTGIDETVPELIKVAKKETDEEIRSAAQDALEMISGMPLEELDVATGKKKMQAMPLLRQQYGQKR